MKRYPVHRLIERHALSTARRILQLIHLRHLGLCRQDLPRTFQLLQGIDRESGATKFGLGGFLDAQHEGLFAIPTIVGAGAGALGLEEAKVFHKLARGVNLTGCVAVVDV